MDKTILDKVKLLAVEAGKYMAGNFGASVFAKEGEHNFVTQTDKDISDLLIKRLPDILPDSKVISEESNENDCLSDGLTWIIDPIDGTSNYMYGFGLSCVSIALLKKKKPVLGVVYNPFTDEMFCASKGTGAFLNGKQMKVNKDTLLSHTLILAETDPYSKRLDNKTFDIVHELFKECIDIRITGSAALDVCYIADGRGGAFTTLEVSPWDIAAGCIILEEAGGRISHMDGSNLGFLGSENVVASNGYLHNEVLEKLKKVCQ